MKRLKAVQALFKRRVLESFAQPDECRSVDQVRRDMIHGDNIQALINLQEPYQGRPELITAEGCAVV